jgi:hypothetical protein
MASWRPAMARPCVRYSWPEPPAIQGRWYRGYCPSSLAPLGILRSPALAKTSSINTDEIPTIEHHGGNIMRKTLCLVALCSVFLVRPALALGDHQKGARIAFANEFIRELSSEQRIREIFSKEHASDASASDQMSTIIRASTQTSSELDTNIHMLDKIELDPQLDAARTDLQNAYKKQIAIHHEIIADAQLFLNGVTNGPKSNVKYDAIVSHIPELIAQNNHLDEIIFNASQAVALGLIDDRPNRNGLLDHLILTKQQREVMIKSIETEFKSTTNNKNQNYSTRAAWLIHDAVLKGPRKSADDPW